MAAEDDRAIFPGGALAVHITHQPIYRALGIENVKHRRGAKDTTTLVLMRRLLSLDYLIGRPTLGWLPTEADKVQQFEALGHRPSRLAVPKIWRGREGANPMFCAETSDHAGRVPSGSCCNNSRRSAALSNPPAARKRSRLPAVMAFSSRAISWRIPGSAAVRKAFRHRALVQRCQWHKRENVVSYLAKREQPVWRQRLQHAYNRPEYDEALAALQSLQHELEDRNQSAAGSLAEGLDETLTLHRLGVVRPVGPIAEDDERPRVHQRAH